MTDDSRTTQEAQIRTLIGAWAEAIRKKDAGGVVRHHGPNFVHFSLAPPLQSMTADAKGLEKWFATWRGPIGYEVHDLNITAGGDVAFSSSLNRLSGTTVDGETSSIWFRHTLGLRRIAGTWKIVHEHESVPFYMDGSYKAAVDLKR